MNIIIFLNFLFHIFIILCWFQHISLNEIVYSNVVLISFRRMSVKKFFRHFSDIFIYNRSLTVTSKNKNLNKKFEINVFNTRRYYVSTIKVTRLCEEKVKKKKTS